MKVNCIDLFWCSKNLLGKVSNFISINVNFLLEKIIPFFVCSYNLKKKKCSCVAVKMFYTQTRQRLYYSIFSSQSDDKDIDVGMFLSMSRICYERLGLYAEGLDLSKRALNFQTSSYSKQFTSRYVCHNITFYF